VNRIHADRDVQVERKGREESIGSKGRYVVAAGFEQHLEETGILRIRVCGSPEFRRAVRATFRSVCQQETNEI
jgi:hypothetical protein